MVVSIGVFVSWALGLASETMIKGVASEAVKDAYGALKHTIGQWLEGDAAALEKAPDSKARQAVVAEAVDALPQGDQSALHQLAQNLAAALKDQAPAIGLDIGKLDGAEVKLGNIAVTSGIGARVQDIQGGSFTTGDITVGGGPGKT